MNSNDKLDIKKFDKKIDLDFLKNNGRVEKTMDSMVFCSGLEQVKMYEKVIIDNKYEGIVLDLSEDFAGVGLIEDTNRVIEGMEVQGTKKMYAIPVDTTQDGALIDILGRHLDGGKTVELGELFPIFNIAPKIMNIKDVNRPMMTGQLLIDTMAPIGKGQRQLILGSRQIGKTQIALDTIVNQKFDQVKCIYVSIGQKKINVVHSYEYLKKHGALAYTTVLAATASDSLTSQYLAPYVGMTIAEQWAKNGEDVLIVFDNLSVHADIYRAISLLFKRPPGREAYPGDIFYIHASLLERAAQLKTGGSITALPVVELLSDDLTAYIPTNIISITDGQWYFQTDLFNSNQKPAISTRASVSRIGGNAQFKSIKKLSKTLALDLSKFFKQKEFLLYETELSPENALIIKKGTILLELFKQGLAETYTLLEQTLLLFGYNQAYFTAVDDEELPAYKQLVLKALKEEPKQEAFLNELLANNELTVEMEAIFDQIFISTREEFLCQKH